MVFNEKCFVCQEITETFKVAYTWINYYNFVRIKPKVNWQKRHFSDCSTNWPLNMAALYKAVRCSALRTMMNGRQQKLTWKHDNRANGLSWTTVSTVSTGWNDNTNEISAVFCTQPRDQHSHALVNTRLMYKFTNTSNSRNNTIHSYLFHTKKMQKNIKQKVTNIFTSYYTDSFDILW